MSVLVIAVMSAVGGLRIGVPGIKQGDMIYSLHLQPA